jgi:PAS domain S-box-containing protein
MSVDADSHAESGAIAAALAGLPVDVRHLSPDAAQRLVDVLQRQTTDLRATIERQFCQNLLDSLAPHAALLDASGTIIAVNESWRQFAEKNRLRLPDYGVGTNYLTVCDTATGAFSDEAPLASQGIRAVLTGERDSFSLEYPCHSPIEERWFVMRVSRFKGSDPLRVLVMHDNITERKQAENAHAASEERLRQVITSINDHIYALAITADGLFAGPLYVSHNIKRLTGYPPEAFLEDTLLWQRIIHPDDRPITRAQDARLLSGHNSVSEYRIVRADETVIWVRDSARVKSENGTPKMVYGVLSDVTEYKHAEEALRQSEHRFRRITTHIADGIVIVDRDGMVRFVNPAAETLLGRRADELVDTAFGFPVAVDSVELDVVHKHGAILHVEMRATEIMWGGQPAYLASLRNITERKRAEQELRQYASEQAALYTITSAIAGVLDRDELVNVVLEVVLPVLEARTGWILLADSRTPHVIGYRGMPEDYDPTQAVCGTQECSLYDALISGNSADVDLGTVTCPTLQEHMQDPNAAHACIPLRAGNRLLGILNIGGYPPHIDLQARRDLWLTISHQVGMALHNARLYQAARQVDRLRVLNELDRALAALLDPDTVMEVVLCQIAAALEASVGALLILDPLPHSHTRRVFSLGQGWGHMPLNPEDDARLNELVDQLWAADDSLPFPAHAFAAFSGHQNVTEQWGQHGLVVPLWFNQELVALLALGGRPADQPFTDEDRALIRAAASRASQAIENARLYRATYARASDLALLNEIGLTLTRTLDYSTVINDAMTLMQRLFQAENMALLKLDPDTGALHFVRALVKSQPVDIPVTLQPGEGIASLVVEQKQPVLVENAKIHPRWSTSARDYLPPAAGALIAAPLQTPERVIGVIEVISEKVGVYTPDNLQTLRGLASTMTVALENARLYQELKTVLRERERSQEQLVHSEKMIALGRLVASIAHEINNPLQATMGCLTLLKEELAGPQRREKTDHYLQIVESEIQRVADILRRMRDFHRPAREERRPTDVHDVLTGVLELTGKQLQHSEVSVERHLESDLPLIPANPDHLRQVFLNLVLNANDAMPQGGHLRIATTLAADGPLPPSVCIEFTDTGAGMTPDVLARLFEPFFTTKETGSGLGLSITYRIVKAHGGEIKVNSRVGSGTTFLIYLPVDGITRKGEE